MKKLALFDFDGTITKKDSFLAFIKFYKGEWTFWKGMFLLSPVLILYKLKILPNWKAKQYVLTHFFHGEKEVEFNRKGEAFSSVVIPKLVRKKAKNKLYWHIARGDEVVVVTASAQNWVKPWTDQLGIDLIATELETKDNLLTGKILGKNCYGPEKVTRVCELRELRSYEDIYVYGDSKGDKELLDIGTQRFYRKF